MLIIPVSDGPQRRFPCLTILLILLNIGLFIYFQHSQQQGYMQAVSWARSSGLLEIETQVYQEYLQRRHETIPDVLHDTEKPSTLFQHLIQDDQFQSALRQHILIPPADPRFAEWSPKRKIFEEKLSQSLAYRFGYSPARKNYLGITTYMFLHDGIIPLAGNMLFLWFIGSWLEIGVGRILYLGIYLMTGAFSGLAFGFIHPFSQGPLLGASGAIAGLTGTYLLLYCGKRSKVLCSLGFCSRYTTVFGWFLFPFWISKEVYLLANFPEIQVIPAHIGGLLAGVIIGLIFRTHEEKHIAEKESPIPTRTTESHAPPLLPEQHLQIPDNLSDKEATSIRKNTLEALSNDPHNLTELTRLFHLDKRSPESNQFHKTAGRLLQQLAEQGTNQDLSFYFQEYKQVSSAPRLPPSVMLALAEIHIHSGKTTQAAQLLLLLIKQRPQYPGLPSTLFKLGGAYRDQGKEERAKKCFQL
ncbi:MAG: rhomboid family intramembrane serine protease, partial [Candidatus Electrothrix sp. ATG1]|nr:rhomboid family intramembrane serine protease [Candidatus Electrothrix sp. ATG1]